MGREFVKNQIVMSRNINVSSTEQRATESPRVTVSSEKFRDNYACWFWREAGRDLRRDEDKIAEQHTDYHTPQPDLFALERVEKSACDMETRGRALVAAAVDMSIGQKLPEDICRVILEFLEFRPARKAVAFFAEEEAYRKKKINAELQRFLHDRVSSWVEYVLDYILDRVEKRTRCGYNHIYELRLQHPPPLPYWIFENRTREIVSCYKNNTTSRIEHTLHAMGYWAQLQKKCDPFSQVIVTIRWGEGTQLLREDYIDCEAKVGPCTSVDVRSGKDASDELTSQHRVLMVGWDPDNEEHEVFISLRRRLEEAFPHSEFHFSDLRALDPKWRVPFAYKLQAFFWESFDIIVVHDCVSFRHSLQRNGTWELDTQDPRRNIPEQEGWETLLSHLKPGGVFLYPDHVHEAFKFSASMRDFVASLKNS
jgi:hypothetical protein